MLIQSRDPEKREVNGQTKCLGTRRRMAFPIEDIETKEVYEFSDIV